MSHPDDERYRVPGTDMQNLTAWLRDNVQQGPPAYWVGWTVVVEPYELYDADEHGVVLPQQGTIEKVGPDCDLTPLYSVRFDNGVLMHGLGEHLLRPVEPGE